MVALGPVHRGAELRRGVEPLSRCRVGVPVDEVPGRPDATPGSPAGSTCSPGILTVTAVVATLPLALIPALNGMSAGTPEQRARQHTTSWWSRSITLVVITVLNIYGVRAGRDHQQHRRACSRSSACSCSRSSWRPSTTTRASAWSSTRGGHHVNGQHVPGGDVHEPVRHLRLRHRVDAGRGDQGPAPGGAQGGARRRSSARSSSAACSCWACWWRSRTWARRCKGAFGTAAQIIEANFSPAFATIYLLVVVGRDLRLLPVDHGLDDPAVLRHGARQPAAVLEVAGQGQPRPAHADRSLHRGRRCSRRSRSCSSPAPAIIAIAATGMIYLSYFLGNIAIMRARTRGWPRTRAPFRLGAGA